jgi:hypothetical protein
MLNTLLDLTLVVVALTMAPALAHALELPGKMRLTKDVYFEVQRIYYPGFTIAGFGGPASILLTVVLLFITPFETRIFWFALIALFGLAAMEIVYWTVIHPVNKIWMHDAQLSSAASGFFSFGGRNPGSDPSPPEWTDLRNRWEYAHTVRAALALCSFVALVLGHCLARC